MKRLIVGLIATAALVLMVSTGSAASITWYYTSIFSGSVSPTSSVSTTLEDVAGGVQLTMAISGTSATEFVGGKGFYFNYNPYATLAGIVLPSLASGTGQDATGIAIGSNAFQADGNTRYQFDLNITFANAASVPDNRLNVGESSSYFFPDLTVAGFNVLSDDLGHGSGAPLLSAVHVQGIGSKDESTWLSPGPAPIPEPGTMLLLGSGLVGLAGWGRKKFRK